MYYVLRERERSLVIVHFELTRPQQTVYSHFAKSRRGTPRARRASSRLVMFACGIRAHSTFEWKFSCPSARGEHTLILLTVVVRVFVFHYRTEMYTHTHTDTHSESSV